MTFSSVIRKVIRIGLLAIGSFLLLLILTLGGGLLFLRSGAGENLVQNLVQKHLPPLLESTGLALSFDEITGPLPLTIRIHNLHVSDPDGVWLTAPEVAFGVRFADLFHGIVATDEIVLRQPVLYRLPNLPPNPETPKEPEQPFTFASLAETLQHLRDLLPRVRLDGVQLLDVRIPPELVGLATSQQTSALEKSASETEKNDPLPDAINFPSLTLTGNGFLTDWRGDLAIEWKKARLLAAQLALGTEGEWLHSTENTAEKNTELPDLGLRLQLALPSDFQENVNLLAGLQLDQGKVVVPNLHIDLHGLTANGQATVSDTNLDGNIKVILDNPENLQKFLADLAELGLPLPEIAIPLRHAALNLALAGQLTEPKITLDAQVDDLDAGGTPLSAALALDVLKKDENIQGELTLNGINPDLGMSFCNDLLGKKPNLNLAFNLVPSENATELTLSHFDFTAAQASIHGKAKLNLPENSIEKALLDADLQAKLPSLAVFSPLVPNLSGSLALDLQTKGSLFTPTANIQVTSPWLMREKTRLENLKIVLKAATQEKLQQKIPRCDGTIEISSKVLQPGLTSAKGDALRLATNWFFKMPTDSAQGEAGIKNLSGTGPGLKLSGDLNAVLPPSKSTNTLPQRLSGFLDVAITDWNLINDLAGLHGADKISSKKATVHATLNADPKQNAQATIAVNDFQGVGVKLNSLQSKLDARDIFGALNLNFNTELGAGSAAGRSWKNVALKANGQLQNLMASLAAQGDIVADLALNLNVPSGKCQITRLQVKDAPTNFGIHLNAPLQVNFGQQGKLQIQGLDASLQPSGVLKGNVVLAQNDMDIHAVLRNLNVGHFRNLADMPLPDATVTADVNFSRKHSAFPTGTCKLAVNDIKYPDMDMPPLAVQLDSTMESGGNPGLRSHLVLRGVGPENLTADVTVPFERHLDSNGLPRPAMKKSLQGNARWKGDLAPLWTFVPLSDRRLTGQGSLNATISGTMNKPEISADLNLTNASYEDLVLGILLTNISTVARIRSEGESTLSLSLADGRKGTASLKGSIGTVKQGLPLNLKGNFNRLAPLRRNDLSITLSGDINVHGPVTRLSELTAGADIRIDQGEFKLVPTIGGSIPSLEITKADQAGLAAEKKKDAGPHLNVTVTLPNKFFVRGRGLESEWRGRIKVLGTAGNPSIQGQIGSVRGAMPILGKEFQITRGVVHFDGGNPPDPNLDIVLTCEQPTILAQALVSGMASSPKLTLTSQPPLPQDEVVAQVLFGESAGKLSRMEAVQLAAELQALTTGKGMLDSTKDALGVDVLRVKDQHQSQQTSVNSNSQLASKQDYSGEEGSPALEMGKYITDKVYVGVEQGTTSDSTGIRVEIGLAPRISLDAATTPKNSQVGINWKKDY